MGEKKMLQKERKTRFQKKSKKAIVPRSRSHHDHTPTFSCPSLGSFWLDETGWGGTTKSWVSSSPSSCCIHQTWPQLVVVDFSPDQERKWYSWEQDSVPFYMSDGKLAVSGISSPAFACNTWNPNGSWELRDCRVTEPFSGGADENHRYMEFTNLIGFQGKYYAISRQGCLALIEDEVNSGIFKIMALGRNRTVPNEESRHFREHLLEFDRDIFLVFLLSRGSIKKVDDVEVFRLDTSRLSWEKVDRLKGDAMFFLQDDCCLGISASELGCSKESNCVYFTHDRADGAWFVYDMETSCIRPTSGPEVDLPTYLSV